jgi:hypothetical protein
MQFTDFLTNVKWNFCPFIVRFNKIARPEMLKMRVSANSDGSVRSDRNPVHTVFVQLYNHC